MRSISRMRPALVFLFQAGMHGVVQVYVFSSIRNLKNCTGNRKLHHTILYGLVDFVLNRRNHGSVCAGRGELNLHNFLPLKRMSVQGIRDFCTSLLTKTFHLVVKSSGFDIILQAPFMIS